MYNEVIVESVFGVIESIFVPSDIDYRATLEDDSHEDWKVIEIIPNKSKDDIPSHFEEYIIKGIKVYM